MAEPCPADRRGRHRACRRRARRAGRWRPGRQGGVGWTSGSRRPAGRRLSRRRPRPRSRPRPGAARLAARPDHHDRRHAQPQQVRAQQAAAAWRPRNARGPRLPRRCRANPVRRHVHLRPGGHTLRQSARRHPHRGVRWRRPRPRQARSVPAVLQTPSSPAPGRAFHGEGRPAHCAIIDASELSPTASGGLLDARLHHAHRADARPSTRRDTGHRDHQHPSRPGWRVSELRHHRRRRRPPVTRAARPRRREREELRGPSRRRAHRGPSPAGRGHL